MLAYLLKSPGSSFLSFRSFLSLFFCSEGLQEPDLHDHKVRQAGKNEGVVPDVQVQIEMKEPAFLQGIFNYCELCVSSKHSERAVKPL
jgi:hypothetical protein